MVVLNMSIKLDNMEFTYYELKIEENKIYLKIDVGSKTDYDSLVKLLAKKYLVLTLENTQTIKATVQNNSNSYSLKNGQTEPDAYHFSIDLEKFDRETEVKKLIELVKEQGKTDFLFQNTLRAVTVILIEKGIITQEDLDAKMKEAEQDTERLLKENAEKVMDEKFK